MNTNPAKNEDNQLSDQEITDSEIKKISPSATTTDIPEFGWSGYAERINGRFAMIGIISILAIEAINKISFLEWAGIISK